MMAELINGTESGTQRVLDTSTSSSDISQVSYPGTPVSLPWWEVSGRFTLGLLVMEHYVARYNL